MSAVAAPEQLELRWQPFVLAPPTFQWYIERRPSDNRISGWLAELKLMHPGHRPADLVCGRAADRRRRLAAVSEFGVAA